MKKEKKSVKPIADKQIKKLLRLLKEKGCDEKTVERTMIENIDGLCFFLRGKFGFAIGKTLTVEEKKGFICEVENKEIVGISRSTVEYAMGNILRINDEVKIKSEDDSSGKIGKVIEILDPIILWDTCADGSEKSMIRVRLDKGLGVYRYELYELIW